MKNFMKKKIKYNETPLILAFYIDREMLMDMRLINPFIESVNHMIEEKKANIMAFFLPCDDGNERIEALNPVGLKEPDMDRINKLIKDIETNFSIGAKMDVPNEEIELNNKECVCGNSNGNCQCE